jgi:hypothetical protein
MGGGRLFALGAEETAGVKTKTLPSNKPLSEKPEATAPARQILRDLIVLGEMSVNKTWRKRACHSEKNQQLRRYSLRSGRRGPSVRSELEPNVGIGGCAQ